MADQSTAEGLRSLAFHVEHGRRQRALAAAIRRALPPAPALLDAESTARRALAMLLHENGPPELRVAAVGGASAEFRCLGVARLGARGGFIVKFRQGYRKIPVFGSFVAVELGPRLSLRAINGTVGEPFNVDPLARLSPAEAHALVRQRAGWGDAHLDVTPRLVYWFDVRVRRWRLVYLLEEVPRVTGDTATALFDELVDAHTGETAASLPRVAALADQAVDGSGQLRTFEVRQATDGTRVLVDDALAVRTFDFGLRSVVADHQLLPGTVVSRRAGEVWEPTAVSAHANATAAARFLLDVLGRQGIDQRGRPYVACIRCVERRGDQEWANAVWLGNQAVFGQRRIAGRLVSYALDPKVVAHELWHGVVAASSRLGLFGETGALHESYSDLFAVLVFNVAQPDLSLWDWEIGEPGEAGGESRVRDLSDPRRHGLPATMAEFQSLPMTAGGDWGGVHVNCAIHSKAVHDFITARDAAGAFLFTPAIVARLLLTTCIEQLSRSSRFIDSRRGLELLARTLLPAGARRAAQLDAIARTFDAAGIRQA